MRAADAVGIRAATLTSVDENRAETIERFRAGALDLLYVAPERASGQEFRGLLREAKIALFAIDEAHCVSEWGHDFRPDYRLLRPLMDDFADVPRLALTATADAHTRDDIAGQLGIAADGMIVSGFDRPNIRYAMTGGNKSGVAGLVRTLERRWHRLCPDPRPHREDCRSNRRHWAQCALLSCRDGAAARAPRRRPILWHPKTW